MSVDTPFRLLLTTDAVGGIWRYSCDLAKSICELGGSVLLACLGPPPSDQQRKEVLGVPGLTVRVHSGDLEWMDDPWSDVDHSGEALLAWAREFKPDIVHLNGYSHGDLPFACPVVVAAHSCICSWWRAVFSQGPPSRYGTYFERVRKGLESASAVVTPSRAMAQALDREYGWPVDRTHVIHNGITRTDRCAKLSKQSICLAAGRLWDRAKNVSVLVEASRAMACPLSLAGEGDTDAHAAVQFLGILPHDVLLERMASAALFVHCALYEPFGLAVLEAASSGCALVLSDIDSLQELWQGAAVFVNPRDPDSISDAVNHLLKNPDECSLWSRRAGERAELYTFTRTLEQYQALYRELSSSCTRTRLAS